jgi:hypothetical protein
MASLLDLVQARQGLLGVQRPSMAGLLGGAQPTGTLASTIQGYQPPKMTAMSNQAVMDYARNVASTAQQNLQQQMSDLDRALVMGQQGIQVGDREALARLMEQIPGLMGATAYHGTPHTIRGKFDISKVGTGEGAQAYGHGMYFAENPKVAEEYRKQLSNFDEPFIQYGKKKLTGSEMTDVDLEALKYLEIGRSNAGQFPHNTVYYAKQAAKDNPEVLQKLDEFGSDVKFGYERNTGNLYKVDIPDEYIPNMLDWDKPFSKQTEQVKEAIKKIEPKIKQISPDINVEKLTGEQIYRAYQQYRGNQPDFASEGLNELGIKGIRYLDQGSRNPGFSSLTPTQLQARIESLQESINSGTGNTQVLKDKLKSLQNEMDSYKNMTSNYVVFNPTDVKILEKNNQKVEGLLD